MGRVLIAILTLAATTLAVPQPAFAALSSADALALTNDLATLSGGWNQPAVDESNTILSRQQYSATDFTDFFGTFFSTHAMTDDLRNYLFYPTFGWFDNTVHLKLQTALSEVLWQRITALTASSVPQMATDVNVRNALLHSHRFLNYFTTSSVLPPDGQEQLYQRYKAYVLQYPQYFSLPYPQIDWPYLGSLRVQVNVNLVDMTSLTDARKNEIATSLNLTGQKLSLWNDLTVLVIDDDGLDASQLQSLSTLYHMTPQSLFFLRFVSVFELLRSSSDDSDRLSPIVSTVTYNNIGGVRVGSAPENEFPSDIGPYYTDVFLIIAAHEVSHVVDFKVMASNPALKARRADLLARAGSVALQYLRSQFGGSAFQTAPQEFFASIANEYFANTQHTLDLAVQRATTGVAGVKYSEPLNQFLFFAEVYAAGGDSTVFCTIDSKGKMVSKAVPIGRDSRGHVSSLVVDGIKYAFDTDASGNVVSILSLPTPAVTTPSPLLAGSVGNPYLQTLSAAGGTAPYSWSLVAGNLPAGLALSSAGVIAGTPTTAGNFSFTVRVADSASAAATQTFSLTVISAPALVRAGALSHIAAGGDWVTTISLINTSSEPVAARLVFHADDGSALSLPLSVTQQGVTQSVTAATLDGVINPHATLVIDAGPQLASLVWGWADVLSSGVVDGFAIFRTKCPTCTASEGTVPLRSLFQSTLIVPYDNTANFVTGVALANLSATQANITATIWDENGTQLGAPTIPVAGSGHTAFVMPTQLPLATGKRGIVQFQNPSGGALDGLGLRFSPFNTFTSVPTIQP
jgi:hypothetical protein